MRPGHFTTFVLIMLLLVSTPAQSALAAPSNFALGHALTTDRRIVVSNNALFGYGFGPDLHTPGLPCVIYPQELNLQDLTLEKSAGGYVASAIFFNPLSLLSELNGNPVSFAVSLVLAPPKGSKITIRMSLTTGSVTVKQGKQELDLGDTPVEAALDIDRVHFALPAALGIASDWDVWAEAVLTAKEPWCDLLPAQATGYTATTPPASVGSLAGDDPAWTITAPTTVYDGFKPAKASTMREGSKLKSLRFERDPDGGLVAVVTMDGDVLALAKAPKGSSNAVFVDLDLADPSFFGIAYPYTIEWSYGPDYIAIPDATVQDPYLGAAFILGTVPVTVDGDTIRFHLGQFTKTDYPAIESTLIPFGNFQTIFFSDEPATDESCICPSDQDSTTNTPESEENALLEYAIAGSLISITNVATKVVASGWIDHDGYFLAQNETELYRGLIKVFPFGKTYEIGVQSIHAQLIDQQSDAADVRDADGIDSQLSFPSTGVRLEPTFLLSRIRHQGPYTERYNRIANHIVTNPIYCDEVLAAGSRDDPRFKGMRPDELDYLKQQCDDIENPKDGDLTEDDAPEDDEDRLQPLPKTPQDSAVPQSPATGLTNPPSPLVDDDNIFTSYSPATPVTSPGVPFPLPFTIATPFEPQATGGDWAVRARSTWSYTLSDGSGASASVSTPFVDSHLLLSSQQVALRVQAPVAASLGNIALTEPSNPRRRFRRSRHSRVSHGR